jgi:hypothetical protein
MKRLIVPGVVLLFAMAMVVMSNAQTASQASSQAPDQASMKSHSMTGCLAAGTEPGSYMLTNVEGSGPKTVGIVSSSADLAAHVGHKVEVTGTQVPTADAEKDTKVPKAEHYMKISKVKMVSATCP